jgi:uncharacterized protein (DUF2249 family)/quercetin dioxygenase-like cupin family protein
MSEANERLRQHPEQRFRPPQIQVDLEQISAKLQGESVAENRKHRQETLYRHGPLTIALFLFEAGASMPQHSAEGTVIVQVLQGRLKMSSEGRVHDLSAGGMLILAPKVRHDVEAVEPTRMLLTVCLESGSSSSQEASGKPKTTIDVRTIPGPQRHPLIFSTFDSLQPGEALEIVNDHDPFPLHNQLNLMKRNQFQWDYLQQGPDVWRVRITRVEAPKKTP